jgi:hypothetical protein
MNFTVGFGPRTGRPEPVAPETNLAFVTDDMRHHAGALSA